MVLGAGVEVVIVVDVEEDVAEEVQEIECVPKPFKQVQAREPRLLFLFGILILHLLLPTAPPFSHHHLLLSFPSFLRVLHFKFRVSSLPLAFVGFL